MPPGPTTRRRTAPFRQGPSAPRTRQHEDRRRDRNASDSCPVICDGLQLRARPCCSETWTVESPTGAGVGTPQPHRMWLAACDAGEDDVDELADLRTSNGPAPHH